MLESPSRNIFTIKTYDGFYRYHAFQRSAETEDKDQILTEAESRPVLFDISSNKGGPVRH